MTDTKTADVRELPLDYSSTPLSRLPFVMPIAAVLTGGLMLSMAHLIATEFKPQDKSESVKFQINPVEEIIDIKPLVNEPDAYEEVETPPPPPTTGVDSVTAVDVPPIKLVSAKPVLTLPPLDIGATPLTQPDKNATPIVRIPPIMPARFQQGAESGYCLMRFNVSPEGQPYDVVIQRCTHSILERASKKAVLKWTYNPKIQNGRSVARQGVETKIRFDLANERGDRLPLPAGY